jgi:putative flippase GtrA
VAKRGLRQLIAQFFVSHGAPSGPPRHLIAIPRNLMASGLSSLVEMIFIPLLVEFGHVHYMRALLSCMLFATAISFCLNKFWVFEARAGRTPRQIGKQALVSAVTYSGNATLIYLLTESVGLHYFVSYLLSNLLVFFGWSYPAGRFFVFADAHPQPHAPANPLLEQRSGPQGRGGLTKKQNP